MRMHHYLTLSNMLTCSRIVATPFIVMALIAGRYQAAGVLFVLGAITDMLDGYFARLFNQPTVLGSYLDPIADKIFFITSFVTLASIELPSLPLPTWFVAFVLVREGIIITGALLLAWRNPGQQVSPSKLGKWTVAGYMVLISWILLCYHYTWLPLKSYYTALTLLTALALYTLIDYIAVGYRKFFR